MPPRSTPVGVRGLNCPNCAAKVERRLESLPGVHDARVEFETEGGVLEYDPDAVTRERIAHTVENTGCDSSLFTLWVDGRRVRAGPGPTAADGGSPSRAARSGGGEPSGVGFDGGEEPSDIDHGNGRQNGSEDDDCCGDDGGSDARTGPAPF